MAQRYTEISSMSKVLNKLTGIIIGCAIEEYRSLVPGLPGSAYQDCLVFELEQKAISVSRQIPVPVVYKDIKLDYGYRIEILAENLVVLELKVADEINPVNVAKILTCMNFSGKSVGLLINFTLQLLRMVSEDTCYKINFSSGPQ